MGGQPGDQSPKMAISWCSEWSVLNICIAEIWLLSTNVKKRFGDHLHTTVGFNPGNDFRRQILASEDDV